MCSSDLLDASFKCDFMQLLRDKFAGRTVLFASHQTDEVIAAHEVIWLTNGKLRARGEPAALLTRFAGDQRITIQFSTAQEMRCFEDAVGQSDGIRDRRYGPELTLTLLVDANLTPSLVASASRSQPASLSVAPVGLADLFRAECRQ